MRNNLVITPGLHSQNCAPVSLPDCHWPFDGHAPQHKPAICISRQEPQVVAEEADGVYLSRVSSKDIGWLSWWKRRALDDRLDCVRHCGVVGARQVSEAVFLMADGGCIHGCLHDSPRFFVSGRIVLITQQQGQGPEMSSVTRVKASNSAREDME
jgi:hypothetical protein